METIPAVLMLLAYVAVAGFFLFVGRPTRFTLLEHQRGVLFRRGLPVKELGSGRYWVWPKREKIFWADTRPIQVSFDSQGAVLGDGSNAAFALLGSVCIREARKAIYSARDYNQLPAFVFLCCTRSVLNGMSAMQLAGANEIICAEIVNRATPKLSAAGFEILTFSLTQLSVVSAAPRDEEQ